MALRARTTESGDIDGIISLCRATYPSAAPYEREELESQLAVFPEGQCIVEHKGRIVGMSSTLVISGEGYRAESSWNEVTSSGRITNHDGGGDTLYGVEFMVHPGHQGLGIGKVMHDARVGMLEGLGLVRIRAGVRLSTYGRALGFTDPEEYVRGVLSGAHRDRVVEVHLFWGYKVVGIARGYLEADPDSRGCAAVMEWVPPSASPGDERACTETVSPSRS